MSWTQRCKNRYLQERAQVLGTVADVGSLPRPLTGHESHIQSQQMYKVKPLEFGGRHVGASLRHAQEREKGETPSRVPDNGQAEMGRNWRITAGVMF